jgi:hypothetical protein
LRRIATAIDIAAPLRWLGRVGLPGLFDGEHGFRLEAVAGGCRLHHGERFSGLLVPLFGRMLDATEQGFGALNQALKESRAAVGRCG